MIIKRSLKRPTTPQNLSVRAFYKTRNKVLVIRQTGGIGDILMQRMMFEDFKKVMPDAYIVFACPGKYKELAQNHPFIDEWVAAEDVNPSDYIASYNITMVCNRHEMRISPQSDKHRSDIWANHCGVILNNHNMHMNLDQESVEWGRIFLNNINTKQLPTVFFAPMSAMLGKNLHGNQITETVDGLRDRGLFVYSSHIAPIDELNKKNVPVAHDIPLRKWMGLINAADYVVSVDTASFHLAGGLGKPLVGIFAWTDGKVYGRYYNFELVQLHRDNGNWDCGPCYAWTACIKECHDKRKPCIKEINSEMILNGVDRILEKVT
jgi:ADP-heptose:LPS heptosyltransferase